MKATTVITALALVMMTGGIVRAADQSKELCDAATVGDVAGIRRLLAAGTEVDGNTGGRTALMAASFAGHADVVELLLENKADVNATAANGGTALHVAAQNGFVDVSKLLLEYKADVNAKATYGVTPLFMASQSNHTEVAKLLLDNGADVNAKLTDGTPFLIKACSLGHTGVVRLLLEYKADVNAQDNEGATALIIASSKNFVDVVELLLKTKADVNIQAGNGATALVIAAQNGYLPVVTMLISNKADLNKKCLNGTTALFLASLNGHTAVVNALLENGADDTVTASDGKTTALTVAEQEGHTDIVRLLKEHKATGTQETGPRSVTASPLNPMPLGASSTLSLASIRYDGYYASITPNKDGDYYLLRFFEDTVVVMYITTSQDIKPSENTFIKGQASYEGKCEINGSKISCAISHKDGEGWAFRFYGSITGGQLRLSSSRIGGGFEFRDTEDLIYEFNKW